jgi:hypothetical protein
MLLSFFPPLHAGTADDASEGMAAGKLREAAARGNLQEVLRLIEDGAKIQSDEVSTVSAVHCDLKSFLKFMNDTKLELHFLHE